MITIVATLGTTGTKGRKGPISVEQIAVKTLNTLSGFSPQHLFLWIANYYSHLPGTTESVDKCHPN